VITLPTLLAVGGLSLDVVGAFVIAWPDIPKVRLILASEAIRNGIQKLETAGIKREEAEFSSLKSVLETKYDTEIPDSVEAMRVGQTVASRYGEQNIFIFFNQEKQKALGKDLGVEVDYRQVKKEIQSQIDRFQAFVRVVGFLLLATGFSVQIVGQLIN
jgi:hypothetical protein